MELLVIRKHFKSNEVKPPDVKNSPESFLKKSLKYFVQVSDHLLIPNRGIWGLNNHGWHKGENTYTTTIALPKMDAPKFNFITLRRDHGLFDEEDIGIFHLDNLPSLGDFSGISIPTYQLPKILPFVSIHGGQTEEQKPLIPLFVGSEIDRFMVK